MDCLLEQQDRHSNEAVEAGRLAAITCRRKLAERTGSAAAYESRYKSCGSCCFGSW